jgi:hypothetical protein
MEPVVFLALVEHDLQSAEAEREQADSDVIDAHVSAQALELHGEIVRIFDQARHQQHRKHPDRHVHVEDPAPLIVVGDPTADSRPDRRREHDHHSIYGKRGAQPFGRKTVPQDGLRYRLQAAAASSLDNAKQNQHSERRREPA